ncbi:MAG: DUF1902 domain-containing protein [Burkholderiales bacterium]|nr:DUF1902 domain-containing protein [Burkholderiales bacterium]
MYKIGYPFWRFAARLGIQLRLRVDVTFDAEAKVFVATSGDLRGLVCGADTMDELVKQVNFAITDLLELELQSSPNQAPITDLRLPMPA